MTPRPSLSIGIEEEYQIVDPQTRELRSYITEFIDKGNARDVILFRLAPHGFGLRLDATYSTKQADSPI